MKLSRILILTAACHVAAGQTPPRNEQTVTLNETGVRNLGIETVQAEETDFQTSIFALGEVEHTCEGHSVLSSRVPGRIIEARVHKGDFAEKGEVLAVIESRQPGSPPPVLELTAPHAGLVMNSEAHLGAPVEPDKELMEILDLSSVWVVAKVPQEQAPVLSSGLAARIRVAAAGTAEFEAKFLRLGTEADAASGTIDAVFELPNPEIKLRPGMRAEVSLIAMSRKGVLSVPRMAVQGDRSNRYVFIRDYELKHAFVRVPIVAGAMNEDRVEIVSGLLPGDEVVTKGAYALSFAGKGSTSLKEALDAAHGHPHNEDGTEMSKEETDAAATGNGGANDHSGSDHGPLTLFLAIACGVLLVLLVASPFVFRARAKA